MTDDALTVHENCGGDLVKVFGSVGIVWKGGGFYKTESRSSKKSSKSKETTSSESSKSSTSTDSSSTSTKTADKKDK